MRKAIPTRMSVHDLDYDPEFARRLIITLDDVEQQQVLAYDIEDGKITRYATGTKGDLIVANDSLSTEDVHGNVVVLLKPV